MEFTYYIKTHNRLYSPLLFNSHLPQSIRKTKGMNKLRPKSQTMDTRFITSKDSISHGQTGRVHQGGQVGDMWLWAERLWAAEQHGSPAPGHRD